MTASGLANADLYRCAFEGMCDPILLIKDGRFVDCNAAALKMLGGFKKSELVGRSPVRHITRLSARWFMRPAKK